MSNIFLHHTFLISGIDIMFHEYINISYTMFLQSVSYILKWNHAYYHFLFLANIFDILRRMVAYIARLYLFVFFFLVVKWN